MFPSIKAPRGSWPPFRRSGATAFASSRLWARIFITDRARKRWIYGREHCNTEQHIRQVLARAKMAPLDIHVRPSWDPDGVSATHITKILLLLVGDGGERMRRWKAFDFDYNNLTHDQHQLVFGGQDTGLRDLYGANVLPLIPLAELAHQTAANLRELAVVRTSLPLSMLTCTMWEGSLRSLRVDYNQSFHGFSLRDFREPCAGSRN